MKNCDYMIRRPGDWPPLFSVITSYTEAKFSKPLSKAKAYWFRIAFFDCMVRWAQSALGYPLNGRSPASRNAPFASIATLCQALRWLVTFGVADWSCKKTVTFLTSAVAGWPQQNAHVCCWVPTPVPLRQSQCLRTGSTVSSCCIGCLKT